jgi:hypothetical protein
MVQVMWYREILKEMGQEFLSVPLSEEVYL